MMKRTADVLVAITTAAKPFTHPSSRRLAQVPSNIQAGKVWVVIPGLDSVQERYLGPHRHLSPGESIKMIPHQPYSPVSSQQIFFTS